ncbi:MAG TPA: hypothetical protein VEH04_02455 [Verrucomicrobiae bacterium]|nr:hypothetical protein [Verrucomicrobiae bacterium]
MSLGRLLTSGKSLIGLHDGESRYAMREKNRLPKFGSEKNPFTSARSQAVQAEFNRRLPHETGASRPVNEVLPKAMETAMPPKPEICGPAAVTKPVAVVTAAKPQGGARWKSFFKRLNPLSWRQPRNHTGIARFDKGPVQGELSLERIRVVRNDLSEADVEVVPVKIAVQEKTETPAAGPSPETPELIRS